MWRTAVFCIFLGFIACGKHSTPPDGFTKVSYHNENDNKSIQANLTKGMLVYALNTSSGKMGAKYAPNIDQFLLNNQEVFLPNGDYRFFSIGYDSGTTDPAISSDFFCGDGNNGELVRLSGGAKSVNITLNNTASSSSAVCSNAFADPSHRNGTAIKDLKVRLCAIGSVAPGCTVPNPSSVRIVIGGYDSIFNGPFFDFTNSIKSCHSFNSNAPLVLNDNFPMRIPFRFKLESFNGVTDCSGSPVRSILFGAGIEGTSNNSDRYIDNTNSTYVEIGIGV